MSVFELSLKAHKSGVLESTNDLPPVIIINYT